MTTSPLSIMEDESPKVWVECLASYNAGKSVGRWVNVPETVEEMQEAINEILKNSGEPFAEEWAFHDSEYFGPFDVSEYEDLESLVKKANIINRVDNLEAFEAWDASTGDIDSMDEDEIIEKFEDEFMGTYRDEEDYAYELMNDCYSVPEHLSNYIDYASFWRDLTYDGYYSAHAPGMEVFIFRAS